MLVKIRSVTGQTMSIDKVDPQWTVAELKEAIEAKEAIPADLQRLIYAGRELDNPDQLAANGIDHDDVVVHLVVRQTRPITEADLVVPNPPEIAISMPLPDTTHHFPAEQLVSLLTDRSLQTMQLSRSIRLFAIIDCIFLLVFSLGLPLLLIAIALPVAGYFGAVHYRPGLLYVYEFYLILNAAFRIYFDIVTSSNIWFLILNSFGILLVVFIWWMTHKLAQHIKRLSATQVEMLRTIEQNTV